MIIFLELPVANGLAAGALFGGGVVAVGAGGVPVGHWRAEMKMIRARARAWAVVVGAAAIFYDYCRISGCGWFKIGVNLKVLGSCVLDKVEQSNGDNEESK